MKKRKSLIEEINEYFGADYKNIDELDRNNLISCLDDVFLWYLLLSEAYRKTNESKSFWKSRKQKENNMERSLNAIKKFLEPINNSMTWIFYVLSFLYCVLTLSLCFGFKEPKYELQETIYSLKCLICFALAKTCKNENNIT